MAEYYPLLAKAVASLPNSTPDTRRVVYERARKALIGQLRTLHPPIADDEIERESVELDRAIARIEDELAVSAATPAAATPPAPPPATAGQPAVEPPPVAKPTPKVPRPAAPSGGTLGPPAKPFTPLRTKVPTTKPSDRPATPPTGEPAAIDVVPTPGPLVPAAVPAAPLPVPTGDAPPAGPAPATDRPPRLEVQRPIAPQPPAAKGPKRQMWIIWAGVGIVVAIVAGAAWKLRDHPSTVARTTTPVAQTQGDSGKISDRVGETPATPAEPEKPSTPTAPEPPNGAEPQAAAPTPAAPAANPEVPVAQRAALLVEAPDEPNKVKTYLGTVVWKLNNVSEGPSDTVGLAVEADIDLPDDKLKAVVTFEKNTDSSLPASHTIKIRFAAQPGSDTGDVKQISVPQLRKEDSPNGDPLAGATVPIVQNSFLVGLSPGNAETANMELLRNLQWIDIPMLLTNGHIAKLTFEKGTSGERDLNDAIAAWQKQ